MADLFQVVAGNNFVGLHSDDYDTIQDAIDALPALGGVVWVEGSHTLSAGLTLPDNVWLVGSSMLSAVLLPDSAMTVISPSDTSTNTFAIGVKNIRINGGSRDTAGMIGIDWHGVMMGTIQDVQIANCETGFQIRGGTPGSAYYSRIDNLITTTTDNGIIVGEGANSNQFWGGRANDTAVTAVSIDGTSNLQIYGMAIEGFTTGIDVGASTANNMTHLEHVRLESGTTGVLIGSSASNTTLIAPFHSSVTTLVSDSGSGTLFVHPTRPGPTLHTAALNFGAAFGLAVDGKLAVSSGALQVTDGSSGALGLQLTGQTVASLPADSDGTIRYASDGTPGSTPVTASGTGCLVIRANGQWDALH